MTDFNKDRPLHSFPAMWFEILKEGEGAIPLVYQGVDGQAVASRWTPASTKRWWGYFLACLRRSNHELQPRAIGRIWYAEQVGTHIRISSRPATKVEQERLRKTCQKPGREG